VKRTSPVTLIVCAIVGAAAGVIVDVALTAASRATFTPSYMLPILLVLLGMFCLAFAWPIRRAVKDPRAPRPDPFRAVRIAALSKASSMLGAASGGFALGLIGYALTRPVPVGLGSVAAEIVTAIAEHLCTLPKDPDERESDADSAGAEPQF
jgi:drug/metabolite transporter (DMT)-like permease